MLNFVPVVPGRRRHHDRGRGPHPGHETATQDSRSARHATGRPRGSALAVEEAWPRLGSQGEPVKSTSIVRAELRRLGADEAA
jgi:hypothetical protein